MLEESDPDHAPLDSHHRRPADHDGATRPLRRSTDPNPREFRVVAPMLVRDNEVIVNGGVGSSIDTGSPDALSCFMRRARHVTLYL